MKRTSAINKLEKRQLWDFLVIGGGASGLGIALDATTRGYKTLLLEAYDFAKGTSSRSTKLVHGGVRYLAQGNIKLVREALIERGFLAKNAMHLFKSQSFVIPSYTWYGSYYYSIGLSVYDWLAGKLSLGRTQRINKKKIIEKLPTLNTTKLSGGVVYKDGQFDDSRLAINLAQSIIENGGFVLNYAQVTKLLKNKEDKRINGIVMQDRLSKKTYEIKSKVVINSTGVFTNDILNMNNPNHKNFVVPSQGTHLVLDRSFLPGESALMIPKTSDGRVLFVVPWHDKLVVGTTDILVEKAELEPKPKREEVDFILQATSNYLKKVPTRKDVLSVFSGLRPLAAPKKEGKNTKEVSRSHKIIVSKTGLISIIGGKWTTYRQMAEDVVDAAIKKHKLPPQACKTKHLSIHGNVNAKQVDRSNHLYIYGSDIPNIKAIQNENKLYSEKLHSQYDFSIAEVVWAVRQEMAQTVEDILARRVRLLFLDARAAIDCAEKVAKIIAQELNKNEDWIKEQTKSFIHLAKGYLLVDYILEKEEEK